MRCGDEVWRGGCRGRRCRKEGVEGGGVEGGGVER